MPDMNILDQIMAMALERMPCMGGITRQEHYEVALLSPLFLQHSLHNAFPSQPLRHSYSVLLPRHSPSPVASHRYSTSHCSFGRLRAIQCLSRRHLQIKRLWVEDFGGLPPDSLWRVDGSEASASFGVAR